ncbi:MAG: hypothetical protein ACI30O_01665 [Muribaculaceae bacterium]
MKRILLLFAITFMAIGQTISARDWTVPSGSSATEAVIYVTLQDKDGANVKPVTDVFELGAFVDGVCRGLGSAQYPQTSTSTCIFVFRIPVTSSDANKTVNFALKVGNSTEYTLSEVSGTATITLTGGDQTIGYPSGSHKLLFTAPTGVHASGDGIIKMDVYDNVNLSDALIFEPEGANIPDNYTVNVGNYTDFMSVENGILSALKPNLPSDYNQNISVEFHSNTVENPVMSEIPVAISNPIASISLKDASQNTLTVSVNDSETTKKLTALIDVAGKYVNAEYTGQIFWTLKSGDATGIDLVEGGTHVTPVKVGTYVLTANNEGGNLSGVDITLNVIKPAIGLTALYPNGITVIEGSEMNQYLDYLYEIEPADATHGKKDVTYTFSGTDDEGNNIFETLSYVGRGEITYAYGIGSGFITVTHPDIQETLSIPVTVVKGVPGPKEEPLESLSISVTADQIGTQDITENLKSHVNGTKRWGWDEFTWESADQKIVAPAVTSSGFIAVGYGMTTISGSKTINVCGFDDEGNFNARLEQTGVLMFDVSIEKGLSGISIEGFTIGCEDKDYTLTVTTEPADVLLDDAEIQFSIPTLSDQQTPIFSLEREVGTNNWKVIPAYPGSGALIVNYTADFRSEATVTISQHLMLEEGWSWISTYAGPISLSSDNADKLQEARSQTALTYNDPEYGFFGDLNSLDNSSAYKVNVKQGTTFDYTVDNARLYTNEVTSINLQPGWNWISNPCARTHSFLEIFGKAQLPQDSRVVAQTGFMAYGENEWQGSLESFNAGEGYLIYNPGTTNILFEIQPDRLLSEYVPANESYASPARMRMANVKANIPALSYNPRRFADNMTIIASLPEGMDSDRYTVVPFVGDECRGESKCVNGLYFITVHGQKDEQVSFRVFDNQTGEYEKALNEMPFSMMAGSMKAPLILNASMSGVEIITIDQYNQDGSAPVIYDMQGRRVGKNARGLLIVNGRKVFVK